MEEEELTKLYGSPKKYEPTFKGPIKKRSCTDVICLLLLIVFITCWIGIGLLSFTWGNPTKLIYPSDSNGEICGRQNNEGRPHLLFFNLMECLRPSALTSGCPTPQVCVAECPSTIMSFWAEAKIRDVRDKMRPYCSIRAKKEDFENDRENGKELIRNRLCPSWVLTSKPLLGRCIPSFHSMNNEEVHNNTVIFDTDETMDNTAITGEKLFKALRSVADILNLKEISEKAFNDLSNTYWVIILGLVFAMAIALLWITLMRFTAKVMIWTTLVLSLASLVGCAVFSYFKYAELKDFVYTSDYEFDLGFESRFAEITHNPKLWLGILIVSSVIVIVLVLLLIILRTRIAIAIELIEEASKAVGGMMSTLWYPILPFFGELVVIFWFIIVAMFFASSGEAQYRVNLNGDTCADCMNGKVPFKTGDSCHIEIFNCSSSPDCKLSRCEFFRYGPTDVANILQLINLFGLFWGLFFISAMGQMILAGAFASWYWAFDKKRDVPSTPLLSSSYRTFRYHLGTLAFGSLIIAIIRFIRVMLERVEEKLKQYHQDNPVVKAILCCCKCCFWCLEKFMRFLNRNAYIMTAIYGYNFCSSAREAFSLLMRNAVRVIVLDSVTDFILLLSKMFIVGIVGIGTFFVFSGKITFLILPQLNYPLLPISIILIGTFFIADSFFGVYEMAVDTLFLCFLEDIERHDGTPEKPYYMSKNLKKILGYSKSKKVSPAPKSTTKSE
ncbi:choline transporter-like protein 2 [Lepeophtheirus salmonis]|uniref:choline transporter-like protein 2 n=1 Tax=Lepeophtheirus salmonis TaxID=72036 RepID=UPI001AE9794D|nr:choline transporter-like protein 2 [Lepeophtheirus salmonis]XP_040581980.1 choline transporter-like protein 2 [Lepeophtheirus salmonis]XP_040581988.1 choline transporter-like protein 2 [Lepeophtheirus salmonis]